MQADAGVAMGSDRDHLFCLVDGRHDHQSHCHLRQLALAAAGAVS